MVTGAVALAEYAHIVAEKYPITVALHTDHCPKDKLDTYVRPLLAISQKRVAEGATRCSSRTCGTAPRYRSTRTSTSPASCSRSDAAAKIILEIEIGVVGGEEDGVEAEINDKLYTTPEDFEKTIEALGAGEHGKYLLAATFGNVHGVYKPGNVKLRPDILDQGQKVAAAKLGLPSDAKPFDFVFHGGSGSLKSEIEDSLNYGVVKMNVDTDTQYAFTRPLAAHMFANYDGVLKVDGEVGNKKAYDPRSYLKKAEASMSERVVEACTGPAQRGPIVTAASCWRLADLPMVVAELQVEAARRPGLRRVRHERRDVGLGVVAVDNHLVDAGDHGVPLGRGYPGVGLRPRGVVVVDVVVPGRAAGDAAQGRQVAVLDRAVEVLDRRADQVLLGQVGSGLRVSSTVPSTATATSAAITSTARTPSRRCVCDPSLRLRLGRLAARRNNLWCNGFRYRRGRRGNDLGRRLGRSVDPRRRPRVEAGGGGEPALRLLGTSACLPPRWLAGADMISVAGSWSGPGTHHLGGGFWICPCLVSPASSSTCSVRLGLVGRVAVCGFGHLIGDLVRLVRP